MHPWFTVKKAGSIRSLLICFIAVVGVLLQQLDGDECKSLHRLIVIEPFQGSLLCVSKSMGCTHGYFCLTLSGSASRLSTQGFIAVVSVLPQQLDEYECK
jgi:hypothetical protein